MTTLEKVKQLALEIIVLADNGDNTKYEKIADKIEKLQDYRLELVKIPYIIKRKKEDEQ